MNANEPVSRRMLIGALAAAPLVSKAEAWQAEASATTKSPEIGRDKALAGVREASTTLSKITLPMNCEPSFVFRP